MKKRNQKLLTISILAAIVAAVFIYIVIISVNNKNKSNNVPLPTLPTDGKILLKKDVPVNLDKLRIEEVCTIIATMIKNDAGYAATYIPEKTEIITGEDSEFYKKVCKKQQFDDVNSYDAMLYGHQSAQAKKMTEVVKTYKNGTRKTICMWDFKENMWPDFIADYADISPEHRENVEFICETGLVSLGSDSMLNPQMPADQEYIDSLFDKLMNPEKLIPACCFIVGSEEMTLGFSDQGQYMAVFFVIEWVRQNAGMLNSFISFDLNGTNLSLCFSTENTGLFCWPLSFGKEAVFSHDTAKYNKQVVADIMSFCFDFSQNIAKNVICIDEQEKLFADTQKKDFEGYVLEIYGENRVVVELSVSQLDENGLRFQLKGGNII